MGHLQGVETGEYERWQGVPAEVVGRMQTSSAVAARRRAAMETKFWNHNVESVLKAAFSAFVQVR